MGLIPIKTIAELKTRCGTKDATITLLGKTSPNDGLGGEFYWDDTATDSPDDNLTIQVTGINTGRWKRIISPIATTVVATVTDLNAQAIGSGSKLIICTTDPTYSTEPTLNLWHGSTNSLFVFVAQKRN